MLGKFTGGRDLEVTKKDGSQVKITCDSLQLQSALIEIPPFPYSEDQFDSTKALALAEFRTVLL